MAIKNKKFKKRIALKPCELCGWQVAVRDVAHIIDEIKGSNEWNVLSICPNCHRILDDLIRPKLFRALKESGANGLPESWSRSNKISKK